MKKIIALVLAMVLVIALIPMSVSARTLTTAEKELFDLLKSTIKVADGEFKLPADVVAQGENYVAALDTALTDAQIAAIKAEVDAAIAAVKAEDTGDATAWSDSTRAAILEHVDDAAQVIGCTATADAEGGIVVKDAAGKEIVTNEKLVKTTGFGVAETAVTGAVLLTVLCACAYVSKKVELF